jgi:hypothetical protein
MKTRIVFGYVVVVGMAAAVSPFTYAQPKTLGLPGPEHRRLEVLAGTFNARVRAYFEPGKPPQESTGVMTRTMLFGGRYLKEDYSGNMAGKPFNGMSLIGYDTHTGRYRIVWVDSASTDMMISNGIYDEKSKAFVFYNKLESLDAGKRPKVIARDVLRITGPNQHVFEMYRKPDEAGAKEVKIIDITYTRR